MGRAFKLEVLESEEELKERMKGARTARQKEQLQILWWYKSGEVLEQQELAKRVGRDTSTVSRWLQRYRSEGLASLLKVSVAPGQPRQLTDEALAGLKTRLQSPEGFRSYGEVLDWLNETYSLSLKYPTVYYWVHYRLKAKLKVPRPCSIHQDPAAQTLFKKTSDLPLSS
jgi:transposase